MKLLIVTSVIASLLLPTSSYAIESITETVVRIETPVQREANAALKYIGTVIRDGVVFEVFLQGGKRIYKRLRDSNTIEYKKPKGKQCGYVTETDWWGRIRYKKICN